VKSTAQKRGIVLVNTGTPDEPTPDCVKKYLSEFLMNKRIVSMNRFLWWLILHLRILPSYQTISANKYKTIWTAEGSPFMVAHELLQYGLEKELHENGLVDNKVILAMSYGNPSIEDALYELKVAACTDVLVLPLYPQSAFSSTGAVYDAFEKILAKMKWDVTCQLIDNYYDNSVYIRAIAASLRHAGFNSHRGDKVLMSFHSIPLKDIDSGDTYDMQVNETGKLIANELGLSVDNYALGFASCFGKREAWLSPFSSDILKSWARLGMGRIFVVCPGFSIDCLETLYDIEYVLKPDFLEACQQTKVAYSPENFIYVGALDKSKAHVKVLMEVLRPYVKEQSYA
jgi:ferrochelatase